MGVHKFKFINPTVTQNNNYEIISDDIIRKKLLKKGFEILIVYSGNIVYVAKTLAVIDNQDYIKRDKERPFQNPKLNIPPKLARILINLTGLKKNSVLFDPFCGLATILQEAIMLGIRIYGSDIDYNVILKARKNIIWLSNEYKIKVENISSRIFRADARKITKLFSIKVDGIVTEPLLIPPLKKFPNLREARKMIEISEDIYRNSLNEFVKNLKKGGKLILVVPIIRFSSKEEVSFNPEKEFRNIGLRPYFPHSFKFRYPLKMAFDEDQKVLRKIYLLQKT
jgi:tRNA G10  N-methylase Trm11